MHKALLVVCAVLVAGSVIAQEKKELTPQQQLMGACNKDAEGKKGDERKAFMKTCLADGKKRQQEKMKVCNKDAEGKKGDERKKFMSECLKK